MQRAPIVTRSQAQLPTRKHPAATACAIGAMLAMACSWAGGQTFAEQKSKIGNALESQPESALISLLEAGIREHQPAQASAIAENWLKQNLPKNAKTLYLVGHSAELSGNWRDAAAFYQQFLNDADPKSAEAGDAITATYSLFIDQLEDLESAYTFGHRQAGKLARNPRFRQYDRWFLDQARGRGDIEAAADRLLATIQSGVPGDHMIAFHEGDFVWLLDAIKGARLDKQGNLFNKSIAGKVIALAKAISFDPELSLLLEWKASVKAYNLARIDGEQLDAPLDAAKALLAKFPAYARQVQTDWAGGSNSSHYRDEPNKYWPHQLQGKLPPIHDALGKLNELQKADFLQTWSSGHYQRGPEIISPEDARALALNSPQLVNHKSAPTLSFGWNKLSLEEARQLAPHLEHSPSPEASLIRAIASVGESKDYDKLMDRILGPEVWRLGTSELNGHYADQLWHWAGQPGGSDKRNQQIGRSRKLAESIPNPKTLATSPAAQRLNKFRQLWKEYTSPRPRTPDILNQIRSLLEVTPEAMAEIITNPSPEARLLADRMLNSDLKDGDASLIRQHGIAVIGTGSYDPLIERIAARNGGLDRLKTNQQLYQPHPLLPAIDKALRQQMKGKTLDPWLVMAWINTQFPDNREDASRTMGELVKSAAWKSMPIRVRHAANSHFPTMALGAGQLKLQQSAQADVLCSSLLELKQDSDAATATKAVQTTTSALLDAAQRVEPSGLQQLAALSDEVWANPTFINALGSLIESTRMTTLDESFGKRLTDVVTTVKEPGMILQTGAYIWMHVQRYHRTHESVMYLTRLLADKQPEASSALARIGLQVMARHTRGHTWFKREIDIPALKATRGKTAMQMGLVEIPVPPNHPSYPVYLSQAEWMTENIDSAWKLLDTNWDTFLTIHRDLTLPYLMWALERMIESRDSERQEQLIKPLLAWTAESSSTLRPAEKAAVEIAYGDIAMQRGQLREAHEIFTRVQNKEAYQGLMIRHQAALRRVLADRLAKNFDGALEVLSELELERVPTLWTEIRYARAEVHYDMEEFDDAKDDINSILTRDQNHADAKILLGKIQLKNQKLMEATELEIGSTTSQQKLVPGEKLKVTLNDPTLAVSGAGSEIEVVVWTTTGDREQFFLRQFGDQKTKFRGEVATALGAPASGDGTLQVIGDDEIWYAYSERFREKMNHLEERRGGPIRVASDALLMASARKLLSEADQRRADMEAIMAEIEARKTGNTAAAAQAKLASESIRASMEDPDTSYTLQNLERHLSQITKPGNPIHVRVIDPDRSRTAGIDELTVSVASSSGDSISRVTLRETATHSGWFEGSVATTSAAARAMARDSEPGRNPNMVISANPSYPAWRPVVTPDRHPEFLIDLNDRIQLGDLTINAAEPGFALKQFIVQTAPNHDTWTTVAGYPHQQILPANPWLPSITVVNEADRNAHYGARPVTDLSELREHLESGWMSTPEMALGRNVSGPAAALPASVPSDVKWLRSGRYANPAVVYRFKAHFHEEHSVQRLFQLKLGAHNPAKSGIEGDNKQYGKKPEFLMVVDGKVIGEPDDKLLSGSLNLSPGIHTLEIWATGWLSNIGFGRKVELLTRTTEDLPWEACGDDFFNPLQFPEGSRDDRNRPATITAADDGKSFRMKFAPDSNARMIRIQFIEQEAPVPALNKITLTDGKGAKVLPLDQDFAELNKNDTLEMLTGDRIYIRYRDDRFVTSSKENQERFLRVSFTDARIDFADMEPRWDSRSQDKKPYYEKLLRFAHDQPLSLAIHDADMDSTVEPDSIEVTLISKSGGSKTFTATETGDSTGTFKLTITPVSGKADGEREVQVASGGVITASYLDQENNRPGVPTPRIATIQHAEFSQPEFIIGHAEVEPWQSVDGSSRPSATLTHGFEPLFGNENRADAGRSERIPVRWQIENRMLPANQPPAAGFQAVLGQYLFLEVVAPHLALGTASTIELYAQTDSGRKAGSGDPGTGFDTSVPGTIQLTGQLQPTTQNLRNWFNAPTLASYHNVFPWSLSVTPRYDRFHVVIPLITGMLPNHGVLSREEIESMALLSSDSRSAKEIQADNHSLVARPGERVHLGFRFTDAEGKTQWATSSSSVITHPAFDIMAEDYRTTVETAYAGEHLHLRVVDLGADVSDQIDKTRLLMQAKSGAKYHATLSETGPHTGIFTEDVLLSYTKDPTSLAADHDVVREGFPVIYGDTVAARYTDAKGVDTDTHYVSISKGADGTIAPFSKTYEDEKIAMRTQFSLAEAYLEMAKRHRQLGQAERAEREYASAKLLLSKAMDQFTEPDTRAHAEYLLGTLTMEEAIHAKDADLRETRLRAALSRFMNVTGSYPQSLHASRAQYRIATVYEELGEPEIAAQEYVKLAYKYPDSEYLATSMAKLGSHFLKKANAYEQQAAPLLAKAAAEEDKDAGHEGEVLQKLAQREYIKTASIFGRLQERFPDHRFAGPAGLRAGQAYMRAGHYREAVEMFKKIAAEESYDGPEIRAECIFWAGTCYQKLRMEMAAYSSFKRLTYDFPESKAAANARARLSDDRMLKLESRLELERLEAGQ